MERLKTKSKVVVIWIIVGVLTSLLYATPPSDRCILIKAQVANKEDTKALVNMGLDIWEIQEDGIIIRVTDDERKQIIQSGFSIDTITEDVYEYTEKISQGQISLFADPTPAKYHSHDEVITALLALEDSGVAQTYIIGNTHEGRDIWAVRISDNPSIDEGEPGAIFLGCHHAREWISVEVPLYIAQYLANNYSTDEEVRQLIDNCQIWIVPVVNPDGYEYSRTTDRMWRKNRRDNGDGTFGVDLNRNYDSMWGTFDAPEKTSAITYRGPSAFSEPESQAVRDLVRTYDFRILMSYHSFWQMIYYPWAYTLEPCPDEPIYREMTSRFIEMIFYTSGATYTNWFDMSDTYLLSGDTGDWSYGELGIYSFGIELPPVTYSQGGFRLPESQIMLTCVENLPVALYLISFAAARDGTEYYAKGKIQTTINEASEGDEIMIEPGVYRESILFIDKNLTLRSIDPNNPDVVAATVIEGYPQYSTVTLSSGRDIACVLEGLTITGGRVGVTCNDVSTTIKNCIIESNGPNAIEYWEGREPPTFIDCNISGQVAEVNDPTFVVHWKLDETEGNIAYDSISDNNASVYGGAVWQPTGGKIGGALQLDGIDDWLFGSLVKNLRGGSFSILAWTKGGSPSQAIISQAMSANWLMIDADGKLTTELGDPSSATGPFVSEIPITDGEWHSIALVRDDSQIRLCVDSVLVSEDAHASQTISGSGLNIGVGKNYLPGTYWSGMIDDVRIYDVALSTEQIASLAQ